MGILPRWVWLSALLAAVSGIAADARAAENNAARAALNTITAAELANHVNMLATDAFEGREVLEENHVQPAGEDGGYVQSFGDGYRNILGMIPGRDPKLKHECILIGGHYDHVGFGTSRNSFGPTGSIHNGADDNASGTAGVLEVMQAFTALPEPPRRSVLFAFWDGKGSARLETLDDLSHRAVPEHCVCIQRRHDRPTPGQSRGGVWHPFGPGSAKTGQSGQRRFRTATRFHVAGQCRQ
jgi:hypothetical protein